MHIALVPLVVLACYVVVYLVLFVPLRDYLIRKVEHDMVHGSE